MIGFGEAIGLFFRRYTDFKGRSSRAEYWWPFLMHVGVMLALGGAAAAAGTDFEAEEISGSGAVFITLMALYSLAVMIPALAVLVRRLHDLDKSGWLALAIILVSLVPAVGLLATIAQIVVGCLRGTPGDNRFGAPPVGTEVTPGSGSPPSNPA